MVALFFVAAFGSSLDVAAIQAESPEPLDFNHELQTVGARTVPHDGRTRLYASICFFRSRCAWWQLTSLRAGALFTAAVEHTKSPASLYMLPTLSPRPHLKVSDQSDAWQA
jgi:hypothetical protein